MCLPCIFLSVLTSSIPNSFTLVLSCQLLSIVNQLSSSQSFCSTDYFSAQCIHSTLPLALIHWFFLFHLHHIFHIFHAFSPAQCSIWFNFIFSNRITSSNVSFICYMSSINFITSICSICFPVPWISTGSIYLYDFLLALYLPFCSICFFVLFPAQWIPSGSIYYTSSISFLGQVSKKYFL